MAGIYIHIPFCKSRCKYCDFFSTTHLSRRDEYVSALLREWQMRQQAFFALLQERQETVNTIYIGGGTPTILDEAQLQVKKITAAPDGTPVEEDFRVEL